MPPCSGTAQFRLAVVSVVQHCLRVAHSVKQALVIVKNAPRDRSLAAHLADLARRFPLDSSKKDEKTNSESKGVDRWQERALFLEDEIRALKRKAEADAADIAILRAIKIGGGPGPRKKKKKSAIHQDVSKASVHHVPQKPTVKTANSLPVNAAFEHNSQVASTASNLDLASSQVILKAYERAITIADMLADDSATDKSAYTQLFVTAAHDTLEILSSTIPRAISSASHHITSLTTSPSTLFTLVERIVSLKCLNDNLTNSLISGIVIPYLKSFQSLSLRAIQTVYKSKDAQVLNDVRPKTLLILKHIIQALATERQQVIVDETIFAIAAYAVHELTSLLDPETSPKSNDQRRQENLALGDSVWYLCSVIREVLQTSTRTDKITQVLYQLYDSYHDKAGILVSSLLLGLIEEGRLQIESDM